MRSWNDVKVVICAACLVGIAACSEDDPSSETGNLLPAGGTAGASGAAGRGGSAGTAGTSAGGSATAGSSAGGSANAGIAGAAGAAGAAGSGAEPEADAGAEPSEADAGAEPVEPDAGGEVVVDPPVDIDPPVEVDPPTENLSFETDVLPIFAASCGPCHTTGASGGHSVGGALPGSFNDAIELGDTLLVRISGGATGGMPPGACANNEVPGDPGCLTVAQVQTVADWIEQGSLP